MPEILIRYGRHGYMADPDGLAAEVSDAQEVLDPVLALLRARSGHDFRNYKQNTLQRRIHRRMGLTNRGTLVEYAELLRSNPGEIVALVKDLMISVTGFFRDPEAWTPVLVAFGDYDAMRLRQFAFEHGRALVDGWKLFGRLRCSARRRSE